jgi:hypothetical protein
VGEWDIYLTSEVSAWLEDLQATDPKTADLTDDAFDPWAVGDTAGRRG